MKKIFAFYLIIVLLLLLNTFNNAHASAETANASPTGEESIETQDISLSQDAEFHPLNAPSTTTQEILPDTATPTEKTTDPTVTLPDPSNTHEMQTVTDTTRPSLSSINANIKRNASDTTPPLDDPKKIRLNEILADPSIGNEFIEIHNPTDTPIDISGWFLCDLSTYDKATLTCNKTHTNKYVFAQNTIIKPHDFITLYNKTHFKFGLNNTNEEIFLENTSAQIIDQHAYTLSHKGLTWNFDESSWYKEEPTPQNINNLNPLTKDYPALIINEIFPHPSDDQEHKEFIEIYNPFDEAVSLKNWTIRDTSQAGAFTFTQTKFSPCATSYDTCLTIAPRSFLVIYRSDFAFALNDSGNETVSLLAPNGKTISAITYTGSKENLSHNRGNTWYWGKPTPQNENVPDKRSLSYPHIRINELLPNPMGDEANDEYIELFNPSDQDVALEDWVIRDASTSGQYTFPEKTIIAAHGFFVIYRKDFVFALNNSNETVSLIAPNEKITDTVHYGTTREHTSYNYDATTHTLRWSKHLTPNSANIFNNLPHITQQKIKKIGYKNTWTLFFAKAKDIDHEKLKVRWDFGDDSKSYLWKTRHKYTKNGTYSGSLRIQDASEEIVIPFTITIKKFPKYNMHITQIVPNPVGTDIGSEYITITNDSGKNIDLTGWSIATGSTEDKLVNHPITIKTILKSSQSLKITRTHAAISLPNTTGVVELRAPDGKAIDTASYVSEEKSVPEDGIFALTDQTWHWIIPYNAEKDILAQHIAEIAASNENAARERSQTQDNLYAMIHNDSAENPPVETSKKIYSFVQKIMMWSNAHLVQHTTYSNITQAFNDASLDTFPLYTVTKKRSLCASDQPQFFTMRSHIDLDLCIIK